MPIEIAIGRWLACCAHPVAAWRVLSTRARCAIAGSYAAFAYAVVLATLLVVS